MADDAAAPARELSKPAIEPAEPATEIDDDGAEKSGAESADEADEVQADTDEADIDEDSETDEDLETDLADGTPKPRMSHVRLATIVGLVAVLALGGLVGWLGYRTFQSRAAEEQRQEFIQVGRQGALNLTTLGYEHIDEDVQRILDSATGTFYDDFQNRAPAFADVVKKVKSTSIGSITEAGIEPATLTATEAQVLVAVTVKSEIAGQPEQQPRLWRMRITVQKMGEDTKVSKVDFVQ